MLKKIARTGAVVAVAGLTLSLTACFGGQSVAEACEIAMKTSADANSKSQALMQEALKGGDFAAAFAPVEKALKEAQSKVTNEEVSKPLDTIATEFGTLTKKLEGVKMPDMSNIDMTDPNALAELEKQQAELEKLSTDLQDSSTALTEAGKQLTEVCKAG